MGLGPVPEGQLELRIVQFWPSICKATEVPVADRDSVPGTKS